MESTQQCLECQNPLLGRTDKKYCNDLCRNIFNNRLKSEQLCQLKSVNRILLHNRRVLQNFLKSEEATKVSKKRLYDSGFNFSYHTHTIPNKKGMTYFFIYEVGYLPLEHDIYFLCKRKCV